MSIVLSIKHSTDSQLVEIKTGVFTIGRSRKSDIRLNDSKISGKHIAIEFDGSTFKVKDLDSTNGSFLNGNKIDNKAYDFFLGDEIQIGLSVISIDRDSLNSAELKMLKKSENTEMKFITAPSIDTLKEADKEEDTSEAPDEHNLSEINFSIDIPVNNENTTLRNDPTSSEDDDETMKLRKPEEDIQEASIHPQEGTLIRVNNDEDDTRTNYVLDASDIEQTDTGSLALEKRPQVKALNKKIKKKLSKKKKEEKKGLLSKFFK